MKTLVEAIVLVFLVMYLFLQNFRATLIPTIAVPVVLLGTFGVLAAVGYSINTLTMFGHGARDRPAGRRRDRRGRERRARDAARRACRRKEATRKSMDQITGALVGIALVLSAVFVPMAFFGGSVGVIYRQFSITIVVGDGAVGARRADAHAGAVRDDPASRSEATTRADAASSAGSTAASTRTQRRLRARRRHVLCAAAAGMLVYRRCIVARAGAAVHAAADVVPARRGPGHAVRAGAAAARRDAGAARARCWQRRAATTCSNRRRTRSSRCSPSTASASPAAARTRARVRAAQGLGRAQGARDSRRRRVVGRAMQARSRSIKDAHRSFAFDAAADPRARQRAGFDFELAGPRAALGHDALMAGAQPAARAARRRTRRSRRCARTASRTRRSSRSTSTRRRRARSAWRSATSTRRSRSPGARTTSTTSSTRRPHRSACTCRPTRRSACSRRTSTAGTCATRSGDDGAVLGVRDAALDLRLAEARALQRLPGGRDPGRAGAGHSSRRGDGGDGALVGAAAAGIGYEWTGLSYQERLSGAQAPLLYALSLLVVFLCLAALYESWSIPFVGACWSCRSACSARCCATAARQAGERRLLPGRPAHDDRPRRRRTRS